MNFLFSHRNFPAQFKHILNELGKDSSNKIVFLTGTENAVEIKGVRKIVYKLKRKVSRDYHRYLKQYEETIIDNYDLKELLPRHIEMIKNTGLKK